MSRKRDKRANKKKGDKAARGREGARRFDPTTLEIYRALYTSVAEEMGIALRRTAFSPNIKERRDYSCAVFDADGRVIAQGDHMPVHLGSMPMAVHAALRSFQLAPGDVVALNDPFAGGTHLPDVTLVMGVFPETRRRGDAEIKREMMREKCYFSSPASTRPRVSASSFLRCEPRASRGHWRGDAGVYGDGRGCVWRRVAHPARADCARWRSG